MHTHPHIVYPLTTTWKRGSNATVEKARSKIIQLHRQSWFPACFEESLY